MPVGAAAVVVASVAVAVVGVVVHTADEGKE